jgi:hypothetical protein
MPELFRKVKGTLQVRAATYSLVYHPMAGLHVADHLSAEPNASGKQIPKVRAAHTEMSCSWARG